jgi:F-type H+-transporting ATPase subunit gamma
MTERLADISARIEGIRDLGAVVNAMKGIAAARAHVARAQLPAVDSYAGMIAAAMAEVLKSQTTLIQPSDSTQPGVLVFCAEQGFAGAFSERVLDTLGDTGGHLFLIGTRGQSIASARGIEAEWSAALPSHTPGIPKLADQITTAIYQAVTDGQIDALDVVFTLWDKGRPSIEKYRLFPIDPDDLPPATSSHPLTQMPAQALLAALGQDYFFAQVCKAALHAFAAENEARMEAMSSAASQIATELDTSQATLRRVRQEAITAEIIELGAGAAAKS